MSASENPYAPSQSLASTVNRPGDGADMAHLVLVQVGEEFSKSRLWIQILASLCIAFAGLIVCGIISVIVIMKARVPAPIVILGVGCGILALLLVIGGFLLVNIQQRMRRFIYKPTTHALETAVRSQNSFWRVFGITGIVVTFLILLIIVFLLTITP